MRCSPAHMSFVGAQEKNEREGAVDFTSHTLFMEVHLAEQLGIVKPERPTHALHLINVPTGKSLIGSLGPFRIFTDTVSCFEGKQSAPAAQDLRRHVRNGRDPNKKFFDPPTDHYQVSRDGNDP